MDSLLTKIQIVLDENLNDSDFSIPEFCAALNISRAQLHRKVTVQTGLSTSHYIRELRLEKAKALLLTTDLLVYEVADRVGFKNIAYFSTSFLDAFGYSPKETKANHLISKTL